VVSASFKSAVMSDDEARDRAAEVNEHFRPVELTAETVTRPGGPHSRTVHSFLRHLRGKGLDCVPEPLSSNEQTERFRYIDGESGGDGWKHQHDEHGLRSAATLSWHHFPQVPDRRARIEAFLDAYGMPALLDVADAVIRRRQATIEHVRFLADQGQEPR
jgi:hypothetical protein